MKKPVFYIINGMTLYRLISGPFLVLLIILNHPPLFKWLLLISFLTDAIDGFLARKYRTTSAFGARLDSVADDITILAAIIAMFVWHLAFILSEVIPLAILLILYLVQNTLALRRYKRLTSFHTYSAKVAAIAQAAFLISFFFTSSPSWMFYVMALLTAIDLLEEIILVIILPDYRTNVKGVYWVSKQRKHK
jgi:CDP-diacylglycerol--glycerol-3-phosphate 3-phosphatidyltransferase